MEDSGKSRGNCENFKEKVFLLYGDVSLTYFQKFSLLFNAFKSFFSRQSEK